MVTWCGALCVWWPEGGWDIRRAVCSTRLAAHMAHFEVYYPSFARLGEARPSVLKVYLNGPVANERLHWEIRTVQAALRFDHIAKAKSKWLLDMWPWWYRKLLDIDAHHLLQKACSAESSRVLPDIPRNQWCEHTIGTKALLHLTTLWQHGKDERLAASTAQLVEGIFRRCFVEPIDLELSVPDVAGAPCVGETILMDGHMLVYGSLAASEAPQSQRVAALLRMSDGASAGRVQIWEALRLAWSYRERFMWFYTQLLCIASHIIEADFKDMGFETDAFKAGFVVRKRGRADLDASASLALGQFGDTSGVNSHAARQVLHGLGLCGKRSYAAGEEQVLMRYWQAGREHFSACGSLSISADASRVGENSLMVVAMCGSAEKGATAGKCLAAWAPPQEPWSVVRASDPHEARLWVQLQTAPLGVSFLVIFVVPFSSKQRACLLAQRMRMYASLSRVTSLLGRPSETPLSPSVYDVELRSCCTSGPTVMLPRG